jgi:hypothetical protein
MMFPLKLANSRLWVLTFAGPENMPSKAYPLVSGFHRDEADDRLPIHIAGPIIVALSLSLWAAIGFVVYAPL